MPRYLLMTALFIFRKFGNEVRNMKAINFDFSSYFRQTFTRGKNRNGFD